MKRPLLLILLNILITLTTEGVSVLVCTYNGISRLEPTLEHLFNQNELDDINWEIIIIDNASTDRTFEWLKSFLAQIKTSVKIKLLAEQKAGKSAAISLGIKTAQYSYLLICDDDNWLSEDYLAKGFNILKNNSKIGVIGGNGRPVDSLQIPNWLEPHLHNYAAAPQYSNSADITNLIGSVYGAGMFIRKEIYLKSFDLKWPLYLSSRRENDNIISGEDTEICYVAKNLGYQIFYEESLTFEHDIPVNKLTPAYLLRLFNLFGYSAAILYPYDKSSTYKDKFFIKLALEVYRLIRYNLLQGFYSKDISLNKRFAYRKGYIKGLFKNYSKIKTLRSFLKKIETGTSHHF